MAHETKVPGICATCGADFCEACGDCLACYAEDECLESPDGEHQWPEVLFALSERGRDLEWLNWEGAD